jgi:hypothetical protein
MPAGVLVLIMLAALAVDGAVLFLGEREVADLSAAAASDAAVAAIDADALYRCGNLQLDAARAQAAAQRVVAARSNDSVTGVSATVTALAVADGRPVVTVQTTGTVRLIFIQAVPGMDLTRQVQATASASPEVAGPGVDAVGVGGCG